jgi:hypothetical protein
MITRFRDERGQALVISAVFMTCLVGAVALTIDVGSWFREHRQAQTTADAAALAGAQVLPDDPATAITLAQDYADKNGGGITPGGVTLSSSRGTNDTISVTVRRTAPGFFSKLFAIDSASVHATASARTSLPWAARWAAPIVVNKLHPDLTGQACGQTTPCFGPSNVTTLPLGKTGAPGAFALINLDLNDQNGTIGASELGDWILHGFDAYLEPGEYFSDPGAKWNDQPIQDALTRRLGDELLFPVYDVLQGTGSNAEYRVIAWVGFHVQSTVNGGGSSGSITGYFTKLVWEGFQSQKAHPEEPDFGVRSISLTN